MERRTFMKGIGLAGISSLIISNTDPLIKILESKKGEELIEKSFFPILGFSMELKYNNPKVNFPGILEKSRSENFYKITLYPCFIEGRKSN